MHILTHCRYLGGGISGASTAYFLKKYGVPNVLLLESRGIASGRFDRNLKFLM
ncbi:FAD-binding oxidoreductase [Brasilonema sp. CT11]|nr:FAD-binding oxidoreductase [Brasilonema sp. CT11]